MRAMTALFGLPCRLWQARSRVAPLLCLFALFTATAHVHAQAPTPPTSPADTSPAAPATNTPSVSPPVVPTDAEAKNSTIVLVNEAPYSVWKHHVVRKAEDAVVLVRYGQEGAQITTTGLVVRCDGFILVPRDVRDAARAGQSVTAVVTPVDTGEEVSHSLNAPARPHPGTHATVPYSLMKVTGYHIPCLPLLDSTNVRAGMPVRLLTAVSQSGESSRSAPFTVAVSTAKVGAGPVGDNRDTLPLSGIEGKGAGSVAVGSIVVDGASGAAVGVVTMGGDAPLFTTFARLHVIAGEIGLAMDREAVRLGDTLGKTPPNMVWIPGGAVRLPPDPAQMFPKNYGTDIVCTPGFYVNTYPITQRQFAAWASRIKEDDSLAPLVGTDMPETGKIPLDVQHYMAAHGARLLTEAEWYRASYVPNADWALARDKYLNETTLRIYTALVKASAQAAQAKTDAFVTQQQMNPGGVARSSPLFIPDSSEFEDLFHTEDAALRQEKWRWRTIHPIGLFPEDVSVFGVHDVVTNPVELMQDTLNGSYYAQKYAPAESDPSMTQMDGQSSYLHFDHETHKNGRGAASGASAGGGAGVDPAYVKLFQLLLWHDGWSDSRRISELYDAGLITSKTGYMEIYSYTATPIKPKDHVVVAGDSSGTEDSWSPAEYDSAYGLVLLQTQAVVHAVVKPIFRGAR